MSLQARIPTPPPFPQMPPAMEGADEKRRVWDELRRIREYAFKLNDWAKAIQAYVNTLSTVSDPMSKATYDADADGIADNAELVGGIAVTALMQKTTYDSDADGQVDVADGVSFLVTQASHGIANRASVYHNGTIWVLAQANAVGTVADAVVVAVPDANTLRLCLNGKVTNASHGLTVGAVYYLSPSVAGTLTTTKPSGAGEFIQRILVPISTSLLLVAVGPGVDV